MAGSRTALVTCLVLLCATVRAAPPTPAEDEARIEELMLAESAGGSTPNPTAATAPAPSTVPDEFTPVIAAAVPPEASVSDDWLVSHPEREGLSFADLSGYVGRRVLIKTTGEREHRGTVLAVDAKEVTLSQRRAGGSATYTIKREQVARVFPLRG